MARGIMAAPTTTTLFSLPDEVIAMALGNLDGRDVLTVNSTCRRLRDIVRDSPGHWLRWPTLRFTTLPCVPKTALQAHATTVVLKGTFYLQTAALLALHQSFPMLTSLELDCPLTLIADRDVGARIRGLSRLRHLVVTREDAWNADTLWVRYSLLHPHLERVDVAFKSYCWYTSALERLLDASPGLMAVAIRRCAGGIASLATQQFDRVTSLTIDHHDGQRMRLCSTLRLDGSILAHAFPNLTELGLVRVGDIGSDCILPRLGRLCIADDADNTLRLYRTVRADSLRTLYVRYSSRQETVSSLGATVASVMVGAYPLLETVVVRTDDDGGVYDFAMALCRQRPDVTLLRLPLVG